MHGRGACVAGVCMVGGMAGGACVTGGVWKGGMHGGGGMHSRGVCMAGGHVWRGYACMAGGAYMPQQILQDTVNERAVRILLECILVASSFSND